MMIDYVAAVDLHLSCYTWLCVSVTHVVLFLFGCWCCSHVVHISVSGR